MRQRSLKREAHMRDERIPLVKSLIAAGVRCGICPLLDREGIPHPRCPGIQGMHERRKSSSGGSRIQPLNLIPCCNWSNSEIENRPKLMRDLFDDVLVVREGDPDWGLLGRRQDKM